MLVDSKANIMAVDDRPANLRLLQEMLGQQGYRVRLFPGGRAALASAAQYPPDLILLDINMPEMSGFDVCEHLKADPVLALIPVIFLSALSDTDDKVKAFRSGGVDYVTKPFQFEEVQARVETQLRIHQLQRALREQAEHLEQLVERRTGELTEAHARLHVLDQAKSDFLHLISHELRTPLNGVLGVSDLILDGLGTDGDGLELRGLLEQSRRRILAITENALLWTQIEVEGDTFAPQPVPLASLVRDAIDGAGEAAAACRVRFDHAPRVECVVLGDARLLVRALQALIETAVRFSSPGGTVRVDTECMPDGARVLITSRGATIPPALIPRFFELFSLCEASTGAGDLGLGPAVACRILALFGYSVAVENRDPAGLRMTLSFGDRSADLAPSGSPSARRPASRGTPAVGAEG